jgi:DNA-binding CsgD family transcriptional regulator
LPTKGRRQRLADPLAVPSNPGQQIAVAVMWEDLGEAQRFEQGRLRFPDVPAVPGVYRLRLASGSGHEVWHIGDAVDLRAALYALEDDLLIRTTSSFNARLRDALAAARSVRLEIATTGVLSSGDGSPRPVDLHRQEDRALLRMVARVGADAEGAALFAGLTASDERGEAPSRLDRLTPRQRAVVELVAAGKATREIARELDISPRTVELHRQRAMERLEIRTVPDLVRLLMSAHVMPDRTPMRRRRQSLPSQAA